MNGFFQSIADANRAQCAALGLSACEMYGTPINAAEVRTHELIAAGVPAEAADQYALRADDLRIRQILVHQQRTIRLRNRNYAPGRFANFAKRERWIRAHVEG